MDEDIKELIKQIEKVQALYPLSYDANYFSTQLLLELKAKYEDQID